MMIISDSFSLFLSLTAEPLKREILINTDKLFVERVKLFKDIPASLVSSIAASCRKEQFLPNDLVNSEPRGAIRLAFHNTV
jgi:hypothetical protein